MLVLSSASFQVKGQTQWTLKTDEDGIQLYTKSVPGSSYKSLKTVCTLQTSLTSVAAVLLDVQQTKEWVYGTSTSGMLK